MPWGWGRGRGWRHWYYATGMPGWMRGSCGYPAFGWISGNPSGFCRWFPWLPRGWWTGMYGPVKWTSQGPVLSSQQTEKTQGMTVTSMQPISEIEFLKRQKQMLEEELKYIEDRIKELEK